MQNFNFIFDFSFIEPKRLQLSYEKSKFDDFDAVQKLRIRAFKRCQNHQNPNLAKKIINHLKNTRFQKYYRKMKAQTAIKTMKIQNFNEFLIFLNISIFSGMINVRGARMDLKW